MDAEAAPQPGSTQESPQDSASESTSEFPWDDLEGDEREAALVEAAQAEGELSVYSGFNDEPAMAEAFTEEYGIEVEVYNANSETILQRIVQESSAGRAFNDVLIAPSFDMQAAQAEGLLGTYASEYRDAISEKGKGEQWTGLRRLAFVAGWNTDLISDADVPNDYRDFADPMWNDRISMEIADVDWYITLSDYYVEQGMSEDEVQEMFRQIAENSTTAKGHTVQGQLLSAGQFPVALSLYTQTVERLEVDGAPVTYGADQGEAVEPVVIRYDAGGVMAETDNPAGAALYLDFQLSEGGFEVDRELGALPPIPQEGERLADVETIELDTPAFVERRTEITAAYDELLRLGTAAPE